MKSFWKNTKYSMNALVLMMTVVVVPSHSRWRELSDQRKVSNPRAVARTRPSDSPFFDSSHFSLGFQQLRTSLLMKINNEVLKTSLLKKTVCCYVDQDMTESEKYNWFQFEL